MISYDNLDLYYQQSEQALQPIFPYLADTVRKHCPVNLTFSVIVDLGGGTGQWLEQFQPFHPRFSVLIDHSTESIARARRRLARFPQSAVLYGAAEALPLRPASIDLLVSRNSLHLWPDWRVGLTGAFQALRPGGWCFVGRGFGPDLPEAIRSEVKRRRQEVRTLAGEENYPQPEAPSPPPEDLLALANSHGMSELRIVPDHKAYWLVARKPLG